MFRTRLQVALATLAVAALLQGAVAWWAIDVASVNVLRGRVASDLQSGFLELSASKQRLRAWLSQALLTGAADTQLRDRLHADMAATLVRLNGLTDQAITLAGPGDALQDDARQRREALAVLTRSLAELRAAMASVPTPAATGDAAQAWGQLQRVFDTSQGRDLRTLLAENIAREQLAVTRERAAADRSLSLVRGVAFGATLMLAVAAAALALYFAGRLRRPLDALRAGTEALQHGVLAHRIPALGADEFGALARTVNALAAELEQHRQRETAERLRLEAQVQARTAELQQALHTMQLSDARRRQLFADISHELRTPTTAIRGEAEITLRGRDKPLDEYKVALGRIADASQHLGAVIDDLLFIARHDLDALSLRREPLLLQPVLREALVQAQALAAERGQRIEVQTGQAAAGSRVAGDAQRLRQLFMLLLDNAVAYSHPGGAIRVRCWTEADAGSSGRWWLEVADEGIGIPADELPRVFERRFRGRQARQSRPDGSGLGLAIAQALVRAHGGEIMLHSTPGQGTQVRLHLALHHAAGLELAA